MPSVETVYATKVCGIQGEDTPSHSAASVSLKHLCSMRDSFISGGHLAMTGDIVGFYNCGGGREVRRDTGIQRAEARDAAKCPVVCRTALPQRAMWPQMSVMLTPGAAWKSICTGVFLLSLLPLALLFIPKLFVEHLLYARHGAGCWEGSRHGSGGQGPRTPAGEETAQHPRT